MKKATFVLLLVAAMVLGVATVASAHAATLSGGSECVDGQHVVTWHITNTSTHTTLPMHIDSVDAHVGATSYVVTGYAQGIAKGASTDGTSTVPGGITGTITATLHTSWSDGITATDTANVTLVENCVPNTTTTTAATTTTTTTTTTVPETTTTTVPDTTTTSQPVDTTTIATTTSSTSTTVPTSSSSTPTSGPTTTTTPSSPPLPRTGSDPGLPIFIGLTLLGVGAFLASRLRRNFT